MTGHGPGSDTETVRRMWPDVLTRLAEHKRTSWSLVSQNAQVHAVVDGVLQLQFETSGLATAFRRGPHGEFVRQALIDVLGLDCTVEPVLQGQSSAPSAPQQAPESPTATRGPVGPVDWGEPAPPLPPEPEPAPEEAAPLRRPRPSDPPVEGEAPAEPQGTGPADDRDANVDDPDADDSGMVGADVVAQILGGRVIADHDDASRS